MFTSPWQDDDGGVEDEDHGNDEMIRVVQAVAMSYTEQVFLKTIAAVNLRRGTSNQHTGKAVWIFVVDRAFLGASKSAPGNMQ